MSEPNESSVLQSCRSCVSDPLTPRRFATGSLLTAAFLLIVYLVFVAILATWTGVWKLAGSPSALTIRGWTSEPYDNIFIRAAVWLGAVLIMSLIIPFASDRLATRLPSGFRRYFLTALVAWVVFFAAHLLWMAFVQLVHAQTDIAFRWHIDELMNNPLIRCAPAALMVAAFETIRVDAEKNRAAHEPAI